MRPLVTDARPAREDEVADMEAATAALTEAMTAVLARIYGAEWEGTDKNTQAVALAQHGLTCVLNGNGVQPAKWFGVGMGLGAALAQYPPAQQVALMQGLQSGIERGSHYGAAIFTPRGSA